MQTMSEAVPVSRKTKWTGIVLSAIPVALLALSATMKFAKPPAVVQDFARFGYQESIIVPLGILEIGSAILYAIPRTSVLGAILLTGYLGGAIATCVRVGDPTWPVPVLLGVFAWAGLYLRYIVLRSFIPLRR
jgi:hypothetical protein